MSLYNILFGINPYADLLLSMLDLKREDVGRFRDCYIEDNHIIVYTRNGGNNRADFQEVFDKLFKHPNYVSNKDDNFDCTYATIKFSIPKKYKNLCKVINRRTPIEKINGSEKFKKLIEELKKEKK